MKDILIIMVLILSIVLNSVFLPYHKTYAFSAAIALGNPAMMKAVITALGWTGVVFLSGVAVYLVYDKFVRDWINQKSKPLNIVSSPTSTTFEYTQEFKDFTYRFANDLFMTNTIKGVVPVNGKGYENMINQTTGMFPDGTALEGWQIIENLWFESPLYLDLLIQVSNIPQGAAVQIFGKPVTVVDGKAVHIQEVYYQDYMLVYTGGRLIDWEDRIVVVSGVSSVNIDIVVDFVPHTDKVEIPVFDHLYTDFDIVESVNVEAGTYQIPAVTDVSDFVEAFYPPVPASAGGIIDIPILGDILAAIRGLWDFLVSILNSILDAILSIPSILSNIWDWLVNTITSNIVSIKEAILSIPVAIGNIIESLFVPREMHIDFTPLRNLIIKEKFPFSLPFDIYNLLSFLSAEKEAPKWVFNIKDVELIIDFSEFEHLAIVTRNMLVIIYIIILIILTRRFV